MFELPIGDVYQLHIRLAYIEPPIWRRIVVSGQISLFRLHRMLQVVMGWENYHLHQFIVGTILYGEPDPEFGLEMKDDRRVQLQRIAHEEGTSFIYEYDFGDGWRHVITVERVEPWTQNLLVPRCLDGARACPPEDCGGIGAMNICLQLCEILVILSTRRCVPGQDLILTQNYFHCKQSTQPLLIFERRFLSSPTSCWFERNYFFEIV